MKLGKWTFSGRVGVLVIFTERGAKLGKILVAVRLWIGGELISKNQRRAFMALEHARRRRRVEVQHLLCHFFTGCDAIMNRGLHAQKGMMSHRVPRSPPLRDRIGYKLLRHAVDEARYLHTVSK